MLKQDSPDIERREYIRLDSVFPVQFRILSLEASTPLSDWLQGFTCNVSKTGLCLTINNLKPELAKFLKEGQVKLLLKISMPLAAPAISASAKLVWLKEVAGQPDSYLIGLNYTEIASLDQNRLIRYAMAKKIFVPILSTIIAILALAFIIGSCLNLKLTKDKNALEKTLQSKIGALESQIKTAEGEKTALESQIKTKEKTHQGVKAELEEEIKLEESQIVKNMKDYNVTINLLTQEKTALEKQLVLLQSQEATKKGTESIKKGNFDQAILDINKAIELNPNDAMAYEIRGSAYQQGKGNYDQAILDFSKAIELNPNDAGAYEIRGSAYQGKGNHDQAILDYTKAIEIDPHYAGFYAARGASYYMAKDYDKAWTDVHKAEGLGYAIKPEFLNTLKKASGRDK